MTLKEVKKLAEFIEYLVFIDPTSEDIRMNPELQKKEYIDFVRHPDVKLYLEFPNDVQIDRLSSSKNVTSFDILSHPEIPWSVMIAINPNLSFNDYYQIIKIYNIDNSRSPTCIFRNKMNKPFLKGLYREKFREVIREINYLL